MKKPVINNIDWGTVAQCYSCVACVGCGFTIGLAAGLTGLASLNA